MNENFEVVELKDGSVTLVNTITGEIQKIEKIDLENNVLISKKRLEASKRYFENKKNRLKDPRGRFYIVEMDNSKELVLKLSDRAFALILSLYIDYDNLLCKDGIPLTNSDIKELWKIYNKDGNKGPINPKNIGKKLSTLVKQRVLIISKDEKDGRCNNYRFNKSYFLQGKRETNTRFVKVYQDYLSKEIKEVERIEKRRNQNRKRRPKVNIVSIIGLLHAIMPYIHYQTGYIVKNPHVDLEIEDGETSDAALTRNPILKRLPKSWISNSLGFKSMNRQTLDNYFQVLADAGALKIDDTLEVKMYIVHPYLMYRQDSSGKHMKELLAKFNLHAIQEKDEK